MIIDKSNGRLAEIKAYAKENNLLESFNNAFLAIEKLSQRVTFLLNSEYITGCE